MNKLLFLLGFSSLLILLSCGDDEEEYPFSQSPFVEFENLVFHDSNSQDTIELTFIIWDEEGDIGLDNAVDVQAPYHQYDAIIDENNDPVTISGTFELPFYNVPTFFQNINGEIVNVFFPSEKSLFSEMDNRPSYSCANYQIIETEFQPDTFYIIRNKYFHNLHVDFLDREGISIDFNEIFNNPDCNIGDFNARLYPIGNTPVGDQTFSVVKLNRFAWRVSYRMMSQSWRPAFQEDPFEVQFQVNDRELNESNIVGSGLVTLEEIVE